MDIPSGQLDIPDSVMQDWQEIVNLVADLVDIPAALIMRIVGDDIELFISSQGKANPVKDRIGMHGPWRNSGAFCEAVIADKRKLHVANALASKKWLKNPDVKYGLISYLGFPILLPNEEPFGTLCILDSKENEFSNTYEQLIIKCRNLIQSHLSLLYMNQTLNDQNKELSDYLDELQILRGVVPICAVCKKIRDEKQSWHPIEHFFPTHRDSGFTHTYCPDCFTQIKDEIDSRK